MKSVKCALLVFAAIAMLAAPVAQSKRFLQPTKVMDIGAPGPLADIGAPGPLADIGAPGPLADIGAPGPLAV
jgi:hypothetical protein